jgi:hypothetical protein
MLYERWNTYGMLSKYHAVSNRSQPTFLPSKEKGVFMPSPCCLCVPNFNFSTSLLICKTIGMKVMLLEVNPTLYFCV